jgi:hypothetical protein
VKAVSVSADVGAGAHCHPRTVAYTIRPVRYYYASVHDDDAGAPRILNQLEEVGVNLLAFAVVPSSSSEIQFAIVPEDPGKLAAEAARAGVPLEGPHHAFLVQGDDHLGELASVHRRLLAANVDIYSSSGVSDGRGSFGYIVFVREDQFASAVEALGVEVELP